jgi:anti-sigma factor (TIGR02949 family)
MSFGRLVGGYWCGDVLERLADYIDGEVEPEVREKIEAHLHGCEECTKFGGEYAEVVKGLRKKLGVTEDAPAGAVERLEKRLKL